jgi:hypothetical protein
MFTFVTKGKCHNALAVKFRSLANTRRDMEPQFLAHLSRKLTNVFIIIIIFRFLDFIFDSSRSTWPIWTRLGINRP